MRSIRVFAIVLIAVLSLVSCRRDPNSAKKHYFESGNRYFDKGRYKEASIQYANAIKIDQKYGPAYYKRAMAYLRLKPAPLLPAIKDLSRSVQLLRDNDAYKAERLDAMVKLSDLYIAGTNDKQLLGEAQDYVNYLLGKSDHIASDPALNAKPENDATPHPPRDAFDGHRLQGDLYSKQARAAYETANREETQRLIGQALAEYRQADAAKPGNDGVLLQLARNLELEQQYPEAEKTLRRVLEHDKTKTAAYQDLYQLYMYQGKTADAEQVLKLAIQNNPKEYSYLEWLAMHYGRLGRRDDMNAVLRQIKLHANEWDQAYIKVGDFYLRSGDFESALREYRDGMSKDPKGKVNYQKHIIEVLMRQGKRMEANAVASEILSSDPNDPDARGLQATLTLDRGEIVKALAELQAVVTRAPENPVARYQLGRAHAARREWSQARLQFQKAIEIRPDYIVARLALAQLENTQGQYDAALKAADEIIQKFDRNNLPARLIESAALVGEQKYAESRALLADILKANPNSPDTYYQLGRTALAEKKYKDAEDAFRRSYELNPASARGLMGVVEAEMSQNKPDAALKLLDDELHKSPNRPDLLLDYADVSRGAGRYDQAIASYQKLMDTLDKDSKTRGDLYARLGETYRFKGDYNNSIANFQKARQVLPENESIMFDLGIVLDQAGQRKEAMQVYSAVIKMNPNSAVAMNNLAFLMAETDGDLNQAISLAQKAKQMMPDYAEVSDTLGWIYLKMGNSDSAVGIFKDLVNKVPKFSTYHYHLGMAYAMKGDKTKAIAELHEAMKDNPPKIEEGQIKDKLASLGG